MYKEKETKLKKNYIIEGSSFGKQLERVIFLYKNKEWGEIFRSKARLSKQSYNMLWYDGKTA